MVTGAAGRLGPPVAKHAVRELNSELANAMIHHLQILEDSVLGMINYKELVLSGGVVWVRVVLIICF